jgi:hypothetical protein
VMGYLAKHIDHIHTYTRSNDSERSATKTAASHATLMVDCLH